MSRDSLGYDRIALKANADGAPINFQLHQQIKGAVSLPLTTAVAASAADSAPCPSTAGSQNQLATAMRITQIFAHHFAHQK